MVSENRNFEMNCVEEKKEITSDYNYQRFCSSSSALVLNVCLAKNLTGLASMNWNSLMSIR